MRYITTSWKNSHISRGMAVSPLLLGFHQKWDNISSFEKTVWSPACAHVPLELLVHLGLMVVSSGVAGGSRWPGSGYDDDVWHHLPTTSRCNQAPHAAAPLLATSSSSFLSAMFTLPSRVSMKTIPVLKPWGGDRGELQTPAPCQIYKAVVKGEKPWNE